MSQEIWKDIPGYEGMYQVSNLGNVKSLKNGRRGIGKERILKPSKNSYGYLLIGLCSYGKNKGYQIHRIVCMTFLSNPEDKSQVNHINGIKDDNRLENLEWVTQSENILHAYKTGLNRVTEKHHFKTNHPMKGKFGKDNHSSKKVNQYTLEGEFIKTWDGMHEIQRELGINHGNICLCCRVKRNKAGGFKWSYN